MIGTKEAGEALGISIVRVNQLIHAKRLPAVLIAGRWLIDPGDLRLVRKRKPGRPRRNE